MILRILTTFLFAMGIQFVAAQNEQEFELRICTLLEKSSGYQNIEKIIDLIEWESDIIKNIPCISPIMPPDFRNLHISSSYGERYHPILNEYKHHSGIDIPAAMGDSVYAAANGKIIKAGYDSALGNYLRIQHGYGFSSIYGHLSTILVSVGDTVIIGQNIGLVGNSGRSTGSHLHYAIKKGKNEENSLPYCFLLIKMINKKR